MKIATRFLPALLLVTCSQFFWSPVSATFAQSFATNSRLVLGDPSNKSASIRLGDLDGDKDMDVVVANGRHWPQQNFVFLNQGRARFTVMRPLGMDRATSYACELADLDGDGDLDVVTGNDMAPCQIFLNDGAGGFTLKGTFGSVTSVRSLLVADVDRDDDLDILVTCRGRTNSIYLNDGAASFDSGIKFGTKTDSTIDVAVGDVNGDGHNDLVLANRDGQPNAWLMNDGQLKFSAPVTFGAPKSQSRAVTVGDFNNDGVLDWAVGNIGQPNELYLGDGSGGVKRTVKFGQSDGRTYCLDSADIDLDGDLDLVAGNVKLQNSVFFNNGDASDFRAEPFGGENNATYGLSVGDLNGDGMPDIAVANSDATNHVYLNRIEKPNGKPQVTSNKRSPGKSNDQESAATLPSAANDLVAFQERPEYRTQDWPAFRGLGGRGVAEGFSLPNTWNADPDAGKLQNVHWQTDVPGLGHSSPVIAGDKLFLLTAVASEGNAPLKVEAGGKPTAADDNGVQDWLLLCYQKTTGEELWRTTLHSGKPRATRHAKATHANTSVTVAGDKLVAFLGSEGLHCCDLDGKVIWKQDLGVVNISKYGIGWGFSSSPAVDSDRIVVLCDDPSNPYLAARRLSDGEEIWCTSRKDLCERSWGTPLIHRQGDAAQVVVNGWPMIISYDLSNGKEIWRMKGGGDNPVPTPFEANGLIYITNAHGGPSPIYAVRPSAKGDLDSVADGAAEEESNGAKSDSPLDAFAWRIDKGGSYMSTPVVYGDQIYVCTTRGIVRSFDAGNGEAIFQSRLGSKAGVIASLVAGDGKIYCASENGTVYVLQHGRETNIVAENKMGDPCMATPAISEGTLFIRTTKKLIAIKQASDKP